MLPLAELEAAVLQFAHLATAAGEAHKAAKLYKQAVSINAGNYRLLVAHYVRAGKFKKLTSLARKLTAAGRHDDAKYVAAFIEGEETFRATLEKTATIAELAAYVLYACLLCGVCCVF